MAEEISNKVVVILLTVAILVSALGSWIMIDGINNSEAGKIIPIENHGQLSLNVDGKISTPLVSTNQDTGNVGFNKQ